MLPQERLERFHSLGGQQPMISIRIVVVDIIIGAGIVIIIIVVVDVVYREIHGFRWKSSMVKYVYTDTMANLHNIFMNVVILGVICSSLLHYCNIVDCKFAVFTKKSIRVYRKKHTIFKTILYRFPANHILMNIQTGFVRSLQASYRCIPYYNFHLTGMSKISQVTT